MGKLRVVLAVLVSLVLWGPALAAAGETPAGEGGQSQQGPAVTIVAPESGCVANVGDVLDVLLVVRPDLDVVSVAVLCDARGVGMQQQLPYALKWDTSGFDPGEHVLRAFAYLKSGDKVGAAPVVVTLAQPSEPRTVETGPRPAVLKEGTPVLLQTDEKMVSGQVPEGGAVRYKVVRDAVGTDGQLLAAYGGFAQGHVTRSRKRGMFGKAGQLEFTVDSLTAVDGTLVPLRASQQMGGKDNKSVVIISTLLLSVFSVFVHGKDVELPAGTEIVAYVDHDTEIRSPSQGPSGGAIRGEPEESATIGKPTEGASFGRGESVQVELVVAPERKFLQARLYVDGKEAATVQGQLRPIPLDTRRLAPGNHTLEAEVLFTNGRTMRTPSVRIGMSGAEATR